MAKKKATNQPIVAEEPARSDEQFQLDESKVAPPSSRPLGASTTRGVGSGGKKSYAARSARERRVARGVRSDSSVRREREHKGLSQQVITELLAHPTKTVTEGELRKDYGYVIADLRSMGILAVALIITLVALAQILPK
jgi:hypothetical protein